MWSLLIQPVTELVKQFFDNKKEEKQAQHEAKMSHLNTLGQWELAQAEASGSSWKDEWFTIVLSTPLISIMYGVAFNSPAVIERVDEGFEVMKGLPDWYVYLLGVAVLSSFGIRSVGKFMELRGR